MLIPPRAYLVIPAILFIFANTYFINKVDFTKARNAQFSQWLQTVLKQNTSNFQHSGVFDSTAEGAPKITQVSMQFGGHYDLVYERALRTHIANGEKWGYPTHFLRQDIVGNGEFAEGVYNKLLYLLTIMVNEMTKPFGKRSEWIVWFDADTILLNNCIPWTIFLPPSTPPFRTLNLLVSRDAAGFNAGVFLIRVSEWSINVLSDAIALPRLQPDLELGFREQTALQKMFDASPERKRQRLYVPRHWFNVYDETLHGGKVMNGTMLMHFPGLSGEERPNAMGKWLDMLERCPEELRAPVQNTTYLAETGAYWERVRKAHEKVKEVENLKSTLERQYRGVSKEKKRVFEALEKLEYELKMVIEEEAFDETKMKEKMLHVGQGMQSAKDELRKAEEEKQERQKEEQEKKEKDEKEKESQKQEQQKKGE